MVQTLRMLMLILFPRRRILYDFNTYFTGGVVWVLAIKNVKQADSGLYACEVNSNPVVRSYHKLSGWFLIGLHYFYTRCG